MARDTRSTSRGLWAALAMSLFLSACASQSAAAPPIRQTIQNKGSDTLLNLALAWAEAYAAVRPDVAVSVTGGGSGTGIAALFGGTADLANASRPLSPEEVAAARAAGFAAVQTPVALDAIAVVVNPANPVRQLTIPQLAGIFTGRIGNWRDVGGEDRPIVVLSRESNSGTYMYFLEQVVRQGRQGCQALFSANALLMPSSEGISSEVRQNPNAIGYDGLGYVTPDQKVIAVAAAAGSPYVMPSTGTVVDKSYPIARPLYVVTRGQPSGLAGDYLAWIRGLEGQAIVSRLGFVPLPPLGE